MSEKRVTGPIQVFVIGFEKFKETGKILAELRRVRKRGVIRVVDLLFVQKDNQGFVSNAMHLTDLSETERQRLGAVAGGLIGLQTAGIQGALAGAEIGAMAVAERDYGLSQDQLHDLADSIPNGSAAAILVIEHHWATALRYAIGEAGGVALAQAMISPTALVMVGAELNAMLEAETAIEEAEAVKYAAALEVAQVLADAELIEEIAIGEAADAVATALAVEDAAAEDVAETLVAADLIEEAAMDDAAEVVADALEAEEAAEEIKAAAALEAIRALMAAELIEKEAANEVVSALVAAEIIEDEAAEDALNALLAEYDD